MTWCFREAGEVDTIPTFPALTTSIPGLEPTRRSFPASMEKGNKRILLLFS